MPARARSGRSGLEVDPQDSAPRIALKAHHAHSSGAPRHELGIVLPERFTADRAPSSGGAGQRPAIRALGLGGGGLWRLLLAFLELFTCVLRRPRQSPTNLRPVHRVERVGLHEELYQHLDGTLEDRDLATEDGDLLGRIQGSRPGWERTGATFSHSARLPEEPPRARRSSVGELALDERTRSPSVGSLQGSLAVRLSLRVSLAESFRARSSDTARSPAAPGDRRC